LLKIRDCPGDSGTVGAYGIHSIWGTGTLSWYILPLTIVDLGIFLIITILPRWYKKRRRQDVLPNEQFFAERYYSTIDL
jgi:hypothetical protein